MISKSDFKFLLLELVIFLGVQSLLIHYVLMDTFFQLSPKSVRFFLTDSNFYQNVYFGEKNSCIIMTDEIMNYGLLGFIGLLVQIFTLVAKAPKVAIP